MGVFSLAVYETVSCEAEPPQAVSVKPATVKPMVTPQVDPIDEWTGRILRNMMRMATDEAYRKSIAQKLS